MFVSLAQRKNQRDIPPTKAFPRGKDAICFGQRPPYAKVGVWLSGFRPCGIRHGVFSASA